MVDLTKLKDEQRRLARKVDLIDGFSKLDTVAGCDIAYTDDKVISVIVVCDIGSMKVREAKHSVMDIRFPYIAGFLSYREAVPTVETYHKLELDPDVMIIEGNGILHPRKMGLASHVGLLTDKPTIGVSKKLLCGTPEKNTVYIGKEAVGKVLDTKEKAKPIYLSPGHKVSLKSSLSVVKSCLKEHKLPEPLHLAHKYAMKIKRNLKKG
ncbi:endonuclease V [Candidatus Woesearchaeota archaeon]|nr:endonuclease V [Candidatus Woesearchaeota archaeon]